MTRLNIFFYAILAVCASNVVKSEKVIVCYYGTWATYRSGLGKFDVEHINVDLCTHLVYTFVGINSQGTVVSLDSYLDLPDNWGRNNFGKFNALKQQNPKLKTLLAVGGWNEGSAKYSSMAASPTLRANFVSSALKMVRDYGFDGFDIDWEYPNRRDSVNGQADIDNFTHLVKELRAEFDKYGLLLTAAVASVRDMASLSYDVSSISKYLDFIGLMTYDLYGPWDAVTGHNSPLHRGEGDEGAVRENLYTIDVTVEWWLAQGCPPEKLVLGLPFYGRSFTLTNPSQNSVRAPSSGVGISGPFTAISGSVGYNEFCDMLKTQSWDVKYDSLAEVPYAVQNRNWVSYDDPASITKKVEYAQAKNLAGVMIWSIESDDFRGGCSNEDFPLLRAINRAFGKIGGSTTTTAATETTPSSSVPSSTEITSTTRVDLPTTPSPSSTSSTEAVSTDPLPEEPSPVLCKAEGFASDPKDCSQFYVCIRDGNGDLVPKSFDCPAGLHWDHIHMYCNYPDSVNCQV